ncbi:MAG: hypothetical protein F6J93_05890 [Oscillatoria sp. SIO1A7]|nr:hypothetical protein [Oscillatoria sp. SIO1A7]
MKNNRNLFLSLVLGIILFFSSMGTAQAQQSVSTFNNNPEAQLQGIEILKNAGYTVVTPLDIKEIIENPPDAGSLDGSFQENILNFQQAMPLIPRTNRFFSIADPFGTDLYGVVAGKLLAAPSCPIEIEDTQIVFVSTEEKAFEETAELVDQGYLVYVTPDSEAQKEAFITLLKNGCGEINGATRQVTVDFEDVFYLLPRDLQQPARQQPFIYIPEDGDFIWVVNASQ